MRQRNQIRRTLRVFSIPALCISLAGACLGQDVQTQLQVVSFKSLGEDNLFFWKTETMKSPEEQPTVKASSSTMLPPVTYKGPATLTLMRQTEDNKYQAVARAALPSSSERTIVILVPSPEKNGLPYRAAAVRAGLDSFKPGSRLLVNLSQIPLRGQMGAQPFVRNGKNNRFFVCKPQKMTTVPALDPNAKALASHPVILEYYSAQKKWNILTSTRWFHTPTQRHLIFVYHDPRRKNLILRGVSETLKADTRNVAGNKASEDEDPEARKKRVEKTKKETAERPVGR